MVTVNESCVAQKHIRRAGQDFAAGAELIAAGRRLTARDIGLAAAGNHPWLQVYRRPRIAILATGDEISLPGEAIGPGGIVSSNAHTLAAFVTAAGGEPVVLPIAGDDLAAIAAGADAARGADLLVTTGGASVGVYDLVQPGLAGARPGAGFLEDRHAPGQAADVRPAGEPAAAGPAGQSGFGLCLRGAVPGPGHRAHERPAGRGARRRSGRG